jgi:hypothetical protein
MAMLLTRIALNTTLSQIKVKILTFNNLIMKKFTVLLILILFASCSSEQLNNSALNVANYWQAEKFKVEKTTAENKQVLELTLENLKNVRKDYPKNNVTSISAVRFIENLPESEYADYDNVKVIVKTNGESFEKEYKISEILIAKKLFYTVDQFFQKVKNSLYEQLPPFFDTGNVPLLDIRKLAELIQQVDSTEGKPLSTTIVGFDFRTVGEEKTPVLITHTNASYEKSFVDYTLVLRVSDKKVIHFGINEKGLGY